MTTRFHLPLASWILLAALPTNAAITCTTLKAEYQSEPLAIDTQHPRLTWEMGAPERGTRAESCRVLVANSLASLEQNRGDLWEASALAGRFPLEYQGKRLHSSQICYWKVRAVDGHGAVGPWSAPAHWEMGLLTPEAWGARWIDDGKRNPGTDADFYKDDPAPQFRTGFAVGKQILRARLAITGLGYYIAVINGHRVGSQDLTPAWTRYTKRVYYSVFDVTPLLRSGSNCLGVTLGNGWYNPLPLKLFGAYNLRETTPVGRPCFIARLDIYYSSGERRAVTTDTSWRVADGPIRFNSIYLGERYDARCETPGWDLPGFADRTWRTAAIASDPIGELQCQSQPPIRVTKLIHAKRVTEPVPGVYIFDLGQNFAGWASLTASAPAGVAIVMRYGELLNKNGTLNPMTSVAGQIKGVRRMPDGSLESAGGPGAPSVAWQTDTYVAAGNGSRTYTPSFTFHGFRYVEVTGLPYRPQPGAILGLRLNSDVERDGTFACSDALLNEIQQMCDNTFLSNIFSVQSDCPHRERLGYGGDLAATCDTFMINYNMETFYSKVVNDFADSALPDGMFTDTAPYIGIQYCGFAWAMAPFVTQERLASIYGDARSGELNYAALKKWFDLEAAQYPEGIITSGLSDHESLAPASADVLVTPFYYQCAGAMAAMARTLCELEPIDSTRRYELKSDAGKYEDLAAQIAAAYQATYVDVNIGKIGLGTQASQAIALETGILPASERPRALKYLVDRIESVDKEHLTTGIFGTRYLLDVLSREGRGDLAYRIATQRTFPGWGYMLDNGATTLWEHWQGSDNTYSQNHPMFGSVSEWLMKWVGGIEPALNHVDIHPLLLPELQYTSCSYHSLRGTIVCNWRRAKDAVHIDVAVPVGMTARVMLQTGGKTKVTESGRPLQPGRGISSVSTDTGGKIRCDVASGRFEFVVGASAGITH